MCNGQNNFTLNYCYSSWFLTVILLYLIVTPGCNSYKKNMSGTRYKAHIITYPSRDSLVKSKYHYLQIEFGNKLSVSPDSIIDLRLYAFVKKWLGTPYRWGGTSATGIDCSAFVQRLYHSVYDITLPRTSIEQFYAKWVDLYSNTKYLTEGDLVFFKTLNNYNAVTHVGFYLRNGYFVNASSGDGVSIGRLNDAYWSVSYVAAGRLKRTNIK